MTGQGHASLQNDLGSISVEVRTVNNRGFKATLRLGESLSSLESKIESLARSLIHRGSVQLSVNLRKPPGEDLYQIDQSVLGSYIRQLSDTVPTDGTRTTIDLATLVNLPGVMVSGNDPREDAERLWPLVREAIELSIENLNEMRGRECNRMAESLRNDCRELRQRLEQIRTLAPRAVEAYRARLQGKIERALEKHELEVQPVDLLRELQIFADRADVSEEITRLASHLAMFDEVLTGDVDDRPEPTGRKLDFIIQEMFRETNTIGSKAADADISAEVVEIKCAIERMRELVQNLE